MAENFKISRKQAILLFAGVFVAAFLGITAGTYFVKLEAWWDYPTPETLLKVGRIFPDSSFVGLDGQRIGLKEMLEGEKTILYFLSTDCNPCGVLSRKFTEEYQNVGPSHKLIGISFEPMPKLIEYQKARNLTFPLYQDSLGKFTGEYKITSFPTLMGLNEKREIVFIEFGDPKRMGLKDYLKKL
jgi:peroxiredoxin